jgi:hypothetical protein
MFKSPHDFFVYSVNNLNESIIVICSKKIVLHLVNFPDTFAAVRCSSSKDNADVKNCLYF